MGEGFSIGKKGSLVERGGVLNREKGFFGGKRRLGKMRFFGGKRGYLVGKKRFIGEERMSCRPPPMTTIRQLYLLTALTLIVSIHARLYLDPKHHEMSLLESPNGINIDNKLVSKRYNFAETNPKSDSNDLQTPAPAPAPTIEPFQKHNDKDKKKKLALCAFLKYTEDAVSSFPIIGRGGSGEVYKAYMQDGSAVAIKKIVRPMEGGRKLIDGDTTTSSLNGTWSLSNTRSSGRPPPMTTIRQLYLLTALTLIVSIHARLYLDPKHNEMSQLESPNGIDNKLVSKRYNFAETNPKSNSNDLQAPPPAPAPTIEPFQKHNDKDKKNKLALSSDEAFAFLRWERCTNPVSSLEIIGRGGSGEVYKAKMPDGSTIAIKKVVRPMEGGRELVEGDTTTSSLNDTWSLNNTRSLNTKQGQVRSEIQTVSKIRHRNILRLLGHVPRPDCDYIVTEFMKNGSLQDLLQEVKAGRREFDWLARYNVALGIAHGLEYLHMNFGTRIVHRDLKPANILLGNDMEAKISDFGIAKFIPDTETHMTSSQLAGSLGYIAPEYYQTMKFDEKCDIYSFGVVLAVLVTGKLPSDEFFRRSELSLLKWMRNVMTGEDPKQAIDPKMMGNGYEEQMLLVLNIACNCTLDDPKERPISRDVQLTLSRIKHPDDEEGRKMGFIMGEEKGFVEGKRVCLVEKGGCRQEKWGSLVERGGFWQDKESLEKREYHFIYTTKRFCPMS
ncbi:leucine-rich repeat protein kinase family protein [Artemisia annua]|uniref:Leucine-rich repeat protein kinase family protein n=1 Tax=Artemisia annua TaxID=35608 RepID=A0A2U1L2U8_ARTAN|nr:leucine-rich repeat protein kinase family protein [Artemisia annua]